jgi:hypothetical protein
LRDSDDDAVIRECRPPIREVFLMKAEVIGWRPKKQARAR